MQRHDVASTLSRRINVMCLLGWYLSTEHFFSPNFSLSSDKVWYLYPSATILFLALPSGLFSPSFSYSVTMFGRISDFSLSEAIATSYHTLPDIRVRVITSQFLKISQCPKIFTLNIPIFFFFLFFQENRLWHILCKCQTYFLWK